MSISKLINIGLPKRIVRQHGFLDRIQQRTDIASGLRKFHISDDFRFFVLAARDVTTLVGQDILDIGITYSEWSLGKEDEFEVLQELPGYSARLAVLAPENCEASSLEAFVATRPQNKPLRIAIEHNHLQNLVQQLIPTHPCTFLELNGSLEGLVPEICDLAVDCVETGNTIKLHRLKEVKQIHDSRLVVFVKKHNAKPGTEYLNKLTELFCTQTKQSSQSIASSTNRSSSNIYDPSVSPFIRYSELVYGTSKGDLNLDTEKEPESAAMRFLKTQSAAPNRIENWVIYVMELFDTVFEKVSGYSNHIYLESIAEILALFKLLGLENQAASLNKSTNIIPPLSLAGFIYFFHLPRKFIGLSPRDGQLRCSSWGREYSRDILCASDHASNEWRVRRSRDEAILLKTLTFSAQNYQEYLSILKEGSLDLSQAESIRSKLPIRILV